MPIPPSPLPSRPKEKPTIKKPDQPITEQPKETDVPPQKPESGSRHSSIDPDRNPMVIAPPESGKGPRSLVTEGPGMPVAIEPPASKGHSSSENYTQSNWQEFSLPSSSGRSYKGSGETLGPGETISPPASSGKRSSKGIGTADEGSLITPAPESTQKPSHESIKLHNPFFGVDVSRAIQFMKHDDVVELIVEVDQIYTVLLTSNFEIKPQPTSENIVRAIVNQIVRGKYKKVR
jgi:hypothetical protein